MQAKRKSKDYIPVTVPFSAESPSAKASRAGDLDGKSAIEISDWANRVVWTKRMLNALSVGVRGGKWHALIDKVYHELKSGTYRPRAVRRVQIPKPGSGQK